MQALIEQLQYDDNIGALFEAIARFCEVVDESKNLNLGENDKLRDVLKRASLQMTEVAFFIRDYCKDNSFCEPRFRPK